MNNDAMDPVICNRPFHSRFSFLVVSALFFISSSCWAQPFTVQQANLIEAPSPCNNSSAYGNQVFTQQNDFNTCDGAIGYVSLLNFTSNLPFRFRTEVFNGNSSSTIIWPDPVDPALNGTVGSDYWHCNNISFNEQSNWTVEFWIDEEGSSNSWFLSNRIAMVDNGPDYDALIALYSSTNGNGWTNSGSNGNPSSTTEGWDKDCDYCNWYGIQCDANDRVTCIDLDGTVDCALTPPGLGNGGQNMSGPMPVEIGDLAFLQSLSFRQWFNLGSLPSSIGNLSDLEFLRIAQSGLTGPLPPTLGSLNSLRHLSLTNNSLLDGILPSSIDQCSQLQTLSVFDSQLSGPIPSLISLTNLEEVRLWGNDINSNIPFWMPLLPSVREIYLGDSGFTGMIPDGFGSNASLIILSLENNNLVGCIPTDLLNKCPSNLFNISNNPLLDNDDWASFCTSQAGICITCPTEYNITYPALVCQGENFDVQVDLTGGTGSGPYDIEITDGSNVLAAELGVTGSMFTIMVPGSLMTGNHTLEATITDSGSPCSMINRSAGSSGNITVQNGSYGATITSGSGFPLQQCFEDDIIVEMSAIPNPSPNPPYTYTFSYTIDGGAAIMESMTTSANPTTFTITPTAAGDYQFFGFGVFDASNCDYVGTSPVIDVEVLDPGIYFMASSPTVVCDGDDYDVLVEVGGGSPPYDIQLMEDGVLVGSQQVTMPFGFATFMLSGRPPGVYIYTADILDNNDCDYAGTGSPFVVTINSPLTPSIDGPTQVCVNETITLSLADPTDIDTYFWEPSGTSDQPEQIVGDGGGSQSYELWVTDINGCIGSATTTIDHLQSVEIDDCTDGQLFWFASQGPYYVSWSGVSGGSATTSDVTLDLSGESAGTYFVTVTDADNCSDECTFTILPGDCNHPDLADLRSLYAATGGGATWSDTTGWADPDACDPCNYNGSPWYGIACDPAGERVTSLFLGGNGLSGNLVTVPGLDSLQWIDVSGNDLRGGDWAFNNPNLRVINLGGNPRFNTTFPDFDLPQLELLYCSGDSIRGPLPDFAGTPMLRELFVYDNPIGGTVNLAALDSLRKISMYNCGFTGSAPTLSSSTMLEDYFGDSNNFSGEVPLLVSTQLDTLYLADNNLSGCYPSDAYCSGVAYSFFDNPLLPYSGDYSQFCATMDQDSVSCGMLGDSLIVDCECVPAVGCETVTVFLQANVDTICLDTASFVDLIAMVDPPVTGSGTYAGPGVDPSTGRIDISVLTQGLAEYSYLYTYSGGLCQAEGLLTLPIITVCDDGVDCTGAASPAFIDPPFDVTVSCDAFPSIQDLTYSNTEPVPCLVEGVVPGMIVDSAGSAACGRFYDILYNTSLPDGTILSHQYRVDVTPAPRAITPSVPDNFTLVSASQVGSLADATYTNGLSGLCAIDGAVTGTLTPDTYVEGDTVTYDYEISFGCGDTLIERHYIIAPACTGISCTTDDIIKTIGLTPTLTLAEVIAQPLGACNYSFDPVDVVGEITFTCDQVCQLVPVTVYNLDDGSNCTVEILVIAGFGECPSQVSTAPVELTMADVTNAQVGDEITVEISVTGFEQISALSMDLSYADDALVWTGYTDNSDFFNDLVDFTNSTIRIRTDAGQLATIPDGTTVISLRFDVVEPLLCDQQIVWLGASSLQGATGCQVQQVRDLTVSESRAIFDPIVPIIEDQQYCAGERFNIVIDNASDYQVIEYPYSIDTLLDETSTLSLLVVDDNLCSQNVDVEVEIFDPQDEVLPEARICPDSLASFTIAGWQGSYPLTEGSNSVMVTDNNSCSYEQSITVVLDASLCGAAPCDLVYATPPPIADLPCAAWTPADYSLPYDYEPAGCDDPGSVTPIVTWDVATGDSVATLTWTMPDANTVTQQLNPIQGLNGITWTNPPTDGTLACEEVESWTVTDLSFSNGLTGACERSGQVSPVVDNDYDNCGGVVTATYRASQGSTEITHVTTYSVLASPAPDWVDFPEPYVNVPCEGVDAELYPLAYTNDGNGDCVIAGVVSPIVLNPDYACGDTVMISYSYMDDCGREITYDRWLTTEACTTPALADDSLSIEVGLTYELDILLNDNFTSISNAIAEVNGTVEEVSIDSFGNLTFLVTEPFVEPIIIEVEVCADDCENCGTQAVTLFNVALDDIIQTTFINKSSTSTNTLAFNSQVVLADAEVWIYNRWGQEIYYSDNYANDWAADGYPAGIYFYVIKRGDLLIKQTLTVFD